MQITSCEITNTKYIQIYLTEEELEKQETKELISKYKKENTVEKYLEAGAPIIESYEDYCAACNEVPGQRHIKQMQGTLFDI